MLHADLKGVKKLGLIGDIHGQRTALRRAIDALKFQGVERIACVGDLLDGSASAKQVCDLLTEGDVIAVRGNHDRWLVEDWERREGAHAFDRHLRDYLRGLPDCVYFSGGVLVCHGFGANDLGSVPLLFPTSFLRRAIRLGLIPADCQVIVSGHTHRRRVELCAGILVVELGPVVPTGRTGCAVLTMPDRAVTFVAY